MAVWRRWLEGVAFVVLPAIAIAVLAWIVSRQVPYGAELHGFEAALLDHARRWHEGAPVYGPPDVLFTPLLYAPGFWWATAAVGSVVGLDLTAARIVSALALVGALACLFDLARRLTGDWRYGVLATGFYTATFAVAQGRATIGLVDGPATALALGATVALSRMQSWRGATVAGLLLVATAFTKQNMLVLVVAAGVWTALYRRHLLWPLIGVTGIVGVGLATWLILSTDGWFAVYVIRIPLAVPWRWGAVGGFPLTDLRPVWPALLVVAAAVLWPRRESERVTAQESLAVLIVTALLVSSWLGRLHQGGHVNALIAAMAGVALALSVAAHRLAPKLAAASRTRLGYVHVPLIVIVQFALLAYDPRAYVPPTTGDADVAAIRSDLRALPRPLFLPGDGYWLDAVTGAESFATNDLGYLKSEPWYTEILQASDRAVLEGRYAAVVLPSFLVDAYRDELAPHYRFDRWVGPTDRPVGIRHTDLVGWRTYPYAVFLRTP
ncbi:MAG: glycosyltransferase family 39 protein [Alphaproteobacteria bacterium]|nr:glycosyltransferase family 39 protein [Alphaproteobacteria bacterium]